MKHMGLFEGIGGFSLAARWMGWETVAWCEWNPYGQRALRYHFPEAEGFGDITKTDFKQYANKIDIITGGFPCQPYSQAGKRNGKEDERHLWPEMLRAITEVRPRWVVGENVLGLVNWSRGLVFHEVQADLEAAGYEIWPYVLPACGKNAPHHRDRVWFIAHGIITHTKGVRQKYALENRKLEGRRFGQSNKRDAWDSFPSQSPICNRDDGISDRLVGISFPKWRNEAIKAMGNAIVPQVALEIYKAIELYEQEYGAPGGEM